MNTSQRDDIIDLMNREHQYSKEVKKLQILIAWGREDISTEDAKIALGIVDTITLNRLYVEAIETGKRLVR